MFTSFWPQDRTQITTERTRTDMFIHAIDLRQKQDDHLHAEAKLYHTIKTPSLKPLQKQLIIVRQPIIVRQTVPPPPQQPLHQPK